MQGSKHQLLIALDTKMLKISKTPLC